MGSRTRFHCVGEDPIHPIPPIQSRSNIKLRAGLRSLGNLCRLRGFKSQISYTWVHKFNLPSISRMASGTREDPIHLYPSKGRSNVGPWAGFRSLIIPHGLRDFRSQIVYTGVHKFKLLSTSKCRRF